MVPDLLTVIGRGTVNYGRLTCPECGVRERLIRGCPANRESTDLAALRDRDLEREPDARGLPMTARRFRPATAFYRSLVEHAERRAEARHRHRAGRARDADP